MKVLITGGGGFIGSHLVDSQLAQGHQVRVIDLKVERLDHNRNHPNLQVETGDITAVDILKRLAAGVDVVYHLASAHLDVSLSDADYWRVNVGGTRQLLRLAHEGGVKRVVHCSSNGVLGEIKHLPANESSPCYPSNIYEQSKLEGEQAALLFARETGLSVVVARPAWVYGPRCPRTQKLFRSIKKGRFLMIGSGQTLRHPVFVSDAVKGLELCAQTEGIDGQVYFIAGDRPVTIAELVQEIARLLEVKPPAIRIPVSFGKAAGYGLQFAFKPLGRRPPFSRRSVDFFIKDNAYDISKARDELGFQPQVDLHSGLKNTLDWLKIYQNGQPKI